MNRNRLFYIGIGLLLFVVVTISVFLLIPKEKKFAPDIPNNPAIHGRIGTQPTYYGTDALTTNGLSKFQLDDMEFAVFQYISEHKLKISKIEIPGDSIVLVPYDRKSESTVAKMNFKMVFDEVKTYKVHIEFFEISAIRMYIYDEKGNQVYDSLKVDLQNNTD